MLTILDYSSALEYSIIRRYTNIVYYYYYGHIYLMACQILPEVGALLSIMAIFI